MEFVKSGDSQQLDNWLAKNNASYLQSSLWQRILLATGQAVERVEARENREIIAEALLIYKKLPFGWRYAFCPKGPVTKISNFQFPLPTGRQAIFNQCQISNVTIYEVLADYLRKKKCIFLRCEPDQLPTDLPLKQVKEINPNATLLLDIHKSTDELFSEMHPKTRYNIRVAERKGLKIYFEKNFSLFWELLQKTGARDNFVLHSKESYKKVMADEAVRQITIFSPDGRPVAAGGFIGFGDRYYYLYGALDYNERQLMAPYLLQWTAIQQGKELGYKYYDFFGIAPRLGSEEGVFGGGEYIYDPKHQYAGITRFKLGFGGVPENAPGTFDLIIDQKKYRIYKILRKLRRMLP